MKKITLILGIALISAGVYGQKMLNLPVATEVSVGDNIHVADSNSNVIKSATKRLFMTNPTIDGTIVLQNGATMVNGDANTLTITETNVNIVGSLGATGGIQQIREFNIINYGAISGDGLSDVAAIQECIDSAFAQHTLLPTSRAYFDGPAGTVVIPDGDWDIDASIVLKSHVSVQCAMSASFTSSYDGAVITTPVTADVFVSTWDGGHFTGPRTTSNDSYGQSNSVCILLNSTTDGAYGVAYNTFSNMFIGQFDKAIKATNTAPGWVSANTFSNIDIDRCRGYIDIGGGSANYFSNVTFQPSTTFDEDTILIIRSDYNMFSNCYLWDFTPTDTAFSIYFDAGTRNNDMGGATYAEAGVLDFGFGNKYRTLYTDIVGPQTLHEYSDAGEPYGLVFRRKVLTGSDVVNGTDLGRISFRGYHTDDYYLGADIYAAVSGVPGTSDMPTTVYFKASPNASATPDLYFYYGSNSVWFSLPPVSTSNGGTTLGSTSRGWGDTYLATTKKIDWGNGDVAITHSTNTLALTGGNIDIVQLTGSLTDGAPTDGEIDTITSSTPAAKTAGWQCTILDSDGSGLLYRIESDGTNWQYVVMTKAL